MPSTPVKIGPFAGGLNSYSEPTAIGDTECSDILNFDIDLDGSLYNRYPFRVKDVSGVVPGAGAGDIHLLGFFIGTAETYLIASTVGGTYARAESTGIWTLITNTFEASCMVQYANKAYIVAPGASANPGGSWTPAGGFVAIAAMIKGATAVIYKERMFISGAGTNSNRIYFSNAGDFATWVTATNFFDVRSGDGQNVLKLYVFQDTIVAFKEASTYAFSYDSSPSRGTVRALNTNIGCTNAYSVVEHENSLYVHHQNNVYQLSNWNFTMINMKVPFIYQNLLFPTQNEASLSVMSDRLLVHHFDFIYVFNLRNGTWTKWSTSYRFNYFLRVPTAENVDEERYYGGSRLTTSSGRVLLEWSPSYEAVTGEPAMTCYVVTKVYDFNVAYTFKRLFWWGVDLLSKSDLSYTVHPVALSPAVTHAQLSAYQHNQILGNHLRPIDQSIDVSGSAVIGNTQGNRMFIKLLKGLRFRQVYFTVSGTTTGTVSTSPFRIYSIVAFIDNKELVSKEVS